MRLSRLLSDTKSDGVNILLAVSTRTGRIVLQLGSIAILSRLLDAEAFGILGLATSFIGFFRLFSELGFGQAVVMKGFISKTTFSSLILCSLLFGSLVFLLVCGLARPLADWFGVNELAKLVVPLAVLIPIESVKAVLNGMVQRSRRYFLVSTIQTVSYAIGYIPVTVCFATLGHGYWSIVYGSLTSATLELSILILRYRQFIVRSIDLRRIRSFLNFSLQISGNRMLSFACANVDNLMVGKFLGPVPLGSYTRGYLVVSYPTDLIGQSMQSVLYASMVNAGQGARLRMHSDYRALVGMLCWIMSLLIVFFRADIVRIFLGQKWLEVGDILGILSLAVLPRVCGKISDAYFKSRDEVGILIWGNALVLGLLFGGMLVSMRGGLNKVAWVVPIVYFFDFLRKEFFVWYHDPNSAKALGTVKVAVYFISSVVFALVEIEGDVSLGFISGCLIFVAGVIGFHNLANNRLLRWR